MARKSSEPPPLEPREFRSPEEIDAAIGKIRRRIEELEKLDVRSTVLNDSAALSVARSNVRNTIREVFGQNSPEYREHEYIDIWAGPLRMGMSAPERIQGRERGRVQVMGILNGLVGRLEEKKADIGVMASQSAASDRPDLRLPSGKPGDWPRPAATRDVAPVAPNSRNVFVVHGHDKAVTESVARFLDKLDLNPIILHEQANMGRTVIEKFEAHADVVFAVVLLTPDDVGGLATSAEEYVPGKRVGGKEELRPRARQNVILELGYFIGKLGRARVCALYVEGVELPSDIHGVLYVPYDAANGWRLKLANELRAAGIAVDLNRA